MKNAVRMAVGLILGLGGAIFAENQAPVVEAGADQFVPIADGGTALLGLVGEASDDGLPGGPLQYHWEILNHLDGAKFEDTQDSATNLKNPNIIFTDVGSYMLRFTADDGELSSSDTVSITVNYETEQSETQLSETNSGVSYYGWDVDVSGDTFIIGSPNDTVNGTSGAGSVYINKRNGVSWELEQILSKPGTLQENEYFGWSAAIDGDTIVVGCPYETIASHNAAGAVYVFTRSSGVWTYSQQLTADNPETDALFGNSVAIQGNTIIVGEPKYPGYGTAYVFSHTSSWARSAILTPTSPQVGSQFGISVDIDGNTVIVGSDVYDHSSELESGAAYIFVNNGSSWTQQEMLEKATPHEYDHFGNAVAISGDTVVVGAKDANADTFASAGQAFIFVRSQGIWSQQGSALTAGAYAADNNDFGQSVDIEGDTIVIGDPYSIEDENLVGAVYQFKRSTNTWSISQRYLAGGSSDGDLFGYSVAVHSIYIFAGDITRDDSAGGVSVLRTGRPQAPVANSQELYAYQNIPLSIVLTGSDADGGTLSYVVTKEPQHGELSGTAPNLTYQPGSGYSGQDMILFRIFDGLFYSAESAITVQFLNDADFSRDGRVNMNDWAILAANFGRTGVTAGSDPQALGDYADINRDGVIDIADVAVFCDAWMAGL
jgi:hypothetical protein